MRIAIPVARPTSLSIGLRSAIAGLGGGIAMAIVAALIAISRQGDIWLEAKQIAAVVYGPAAITRPALAASAVLLGTLIHLSVSALLGLLFGLLSHWMLKLTTDFGLALLTGMIYGMLIWLLAYFVILPQIDSALLETYVPAYIVQHIVYGLVTGLLYTWLCPHPYDT
jgi:hypothetical protein